MALPPIITNSPILKALTGTPVSKKETAEKPEAATTTDTVSLSEAALNKLQADQLQTQANARQAAVQVRDELSENPSLTLSKDPQALPV